MEQQGGLATVGRVTIEQKDIDRKDTARTDTSPYTVCSKDTCQDTTFDNVSISTHRTRSVYKLLGVKPRQHPVRYANTAALTSAVVPGVSDTLSTQ